MPNAILTLTAFDIADEPIHEIGLMDAESNNGMDKEFQQSENMAEDRLIQIKVWII